VSTEVVTAKPNGAASSYTAVLSEAKAHVVEPYTGKYSEGRNSERQHLTWTSTGSADIRYPVDRYMSRRFGRALALLREAQDTADLALNAFEAGDLVTGDDKAYGIRPILTELFVLRSTLNPGFESLTGALIMCFENLEGLAPTPGQMSVIRSAIVALRKTPLITLDSADVLVEKLESEGLQPDPVGLHDVISVVDDDA